MLTVGSLFTGIGGLDLGLERAGMDVRWQSEIDPYACRVLARHWPDVPNLGNVKTIDWNEVERVDLICGGYPCQPFSLAGARAGESDARHLWPFFADALRHLRPRYALLENVPGHLSLGFGRVLGDLAELGFDAEWDCIPASAVGAPHLRYRVFVVAHANGEGEPGGPVDAALGGHVVPDADGQRPQGRQPSGQALSERTTTSVVRRQPGGSGEDVADTAHADRGTDCEPPQPARANGRYEPRGASCRDQPRSDWWIVEPDVGRVADGVPDRMDRLRTLGNAVVPQVAEWVGRRIMTNEQAA